jgi:hypothetical protein
MLAPLVGGKMVRRSSYYKAVIPGWVSGGRKVGQSLALQPAIANERILARLNELTWRRHNTWHMILIHNNA